MGVGPYGAIWGHMKPYGTIWDHLSPYGAIWDHLGSSGAIWDHMGPYGATWRSLLGLPRGEGRFAAGQEGATGERAADFPYIDTELRFALAVEVAANLHRGWRCLSNMKFLGKLERRVNNQTSQQRNKKHVNTMKNVNQTEPGSVQILCEGGQHLLVSLVPRHASEASLRPRR